MTVLIAKWAKYKMPIKRADMIRRINPCCEEIMNFVESFDPLGNSSLDGAKLR